MSRRKVDITKLDLSKIGDRVAYIRMLHNLTMKDFSSKIGLSKGNISRLEKNDYEPSFKTIVEICKQFLVDANWLLTGNGSSDLENQDELLEGKYPTVEDKVEIEHMNLVKGFKDKQRALNIDKELIELEKLAPEVFERIESYIKGSVDTLKTVIDKESKSCLDRRRGERRGTGMQGQIPDGVERRSGVDRRKAS